MHGFRDADIKKNFGGILCVLVSVFEVKCENGIENTCLQFLWLS